MAGRNKATTRTMLTPIRVKTKRVEIIFGILKTFSINSTGGSRIKLKIQANTNIRRMSEKKLRYAEAISSR